MADPRPIVLVTGGRDYADDARVYAVLDGIGAGLLIEGGARGADRLARNWADARGVHSLRCDALWPTFKHRAGPFRNTVMVEVAKRLGARVVAFPGGTGTADCVKKAMAAGLTITEVDRAAVVGGPRG